MRHRTKSLKQERTALSRAGALKMYFPLNPALREGSVFLFMHLAGL